MNSWAVWFMWILAALAGGGGVSGGVGAQATTPAVGSVGGAPVTDTVGLRRDPSQEGGGLAISLRRACELALAHPALRAARESVVQADLVDDRILTAWLPKLTATGTFTHFDQEISMMFPDFGTMEMQRLVLPEELRQIFMPDSDTGELLVPDFSSMESREVVIQKQNSFGAVVQLQAPIVIPALIPELRNAGRLQEMARLKLRRDELSFLLSPVSMAYLGAIAARSSLEVARRNLEIMQEHHRATVKRFEVGQATRLTVLQAAMAEANAKQRLHKAETAWHTSERNLEILLQVDGPLVLQPPDIEPAEAIERLDESALLEHALTRREDYAAVLVMVEVARRNVDKLWWRFLPSLVAQGMYRASDSENFAGDKSSWQIGLALSLPIFDGGSRFVERQEALSKLREAEQQARALRQSIAGQISEGLRSLAEAEANLRSMEHALELAREGAAAAKATFEAGMATNLDVIDANQKLFEAEQGMVAARVALDMARLRLEHAAGEFRPVELPGGAR